VRRALLPYSDNWRWLFFDIDWNLSTSEDWFKEGPKWEARRDRRKANKARKGFAGLGQKWRKMYMPGVWVS